MTDQTQIEAALARALAAMAEAVRHTAKGA